jgi:4-amino-4-deoxy-L-arabinose transferase-like glycosyltransferase
MACGVDFLSREKKFLPVVVVSLFIALILPRLISRDIFLDGMTYAAVARNQAENRGGFWNPHYSETIYPVFFEQPPLGLWLQSLAFRIFGDSSDVEFFWGVCCGLIILLLMRVIWRTIIQDHFPVPGDWWPALLFLMFPLVSWTLANNLLENTMTCFVLLGTWAGLTALFRNTLLAEAAWSTVSGLMLAMAILTKGFPAAFIMAIPMTVAVIRKRPLGAAVRVTAIMTAVSFFGLWIVFACGGESAAYFVKNYFFNQLVSSLKGQREISSSQFFLLKKLLAELSVPFLLSFIVTFFIRKHNPSANSKVMPDKGRAAVFLSIALMGSLPLLISPKQLGWYLFPSLPFWAMGIAAAFPQPALKIEAAFAGRPGLGKKAVLTSLALFIIASGGTLLFKGKIVLRNHELFNDMDYRSGLLPQGQTITVYPQTLVTDWYVAAYMQRFLKASLTATAGKQYCLIDGSAGNATPPGYRSISAKKNNKYFLGISTSRDEKPANK